MNARWGATATCALALAFAICACETTNAPEPGQSPSSQEYPSSAPSVSTADTVVEFEKFTLHGSKRDDAGRSTPIELTLSRRETRWEGTSKAGDPPPLSLFDMHWKRLEKTPETSAFRLTYSVDECEHAAPLPRAEIVPSKANPPCYYEAEQEKPRVVREAEVRLKVNTYVPITLVDGKAFAAAAVGTPNVQGLQSALVLSGLAL